DYKSPKVRLPGAGGAPHIAANVRDVVVIVRHTPQAFVQRLDFLTTPHSKGRTTVVSDFGILNSRNATGTLILTALHPGVTIDEIRSATAWPLVAAEHVKLTHPPSDEELSVLRQLTL